jgi:hypothetical protein
MSATNTTQETLDLLRAAQASPSAELAKSTFSQPGSATTGLNYYDLEGPAKRIYPVLTPLRNEIPRVSGKGGIQAAWRAITGINTTGLRAGVSGGNRGGVIAVSTADYVAAYRGIGLEANVDFEADYAAEGFDDARARAAQSLLEAVMIQEEYMIVGGNNSVALGTTPTPTVSASNTGGALSATGGNGAGVYSVICVALAFDAYLNGSVVGGIQGAISRTNADASVDNFGGGAARKSSAATGTISSGSVGSLSVTVAAVNGAVAYAWFWGAAGSEVLGAITTINSVKITDVAAGTQTAASLGANDNSTNALAFDGILTQIYKPGSNAYIASLATGTAGVGSTLTADGVGGIVEIDAALKSFWDNYRLTPDTIWVNSQEALNISKKILAGNANGASRFVFNADQGALGGGVMVREYLNRFSMGGATAIPIRIHPNVPPGTILFTTKKLPYPLSNVTNVLQIRARRDYYQIEWPLRSRKYEYGVYADQVLQCYFPPAFGVITNIANG